MNDILIFKKTFITWKNHAYYHASFHDIYFVIHIFRQINCCFYLIRYSFFVYFGDCVQPSEAPIEQNSMPISEI